MLCLRGLEIFSQRQIPLLWFSYELPSLSLVYNHETITPVSRMNNIHSAVRANILKQFKIVFLFKNWTLL